MAWRNPRAPLPPLSLTAAQVRAICLGTQRSRLYHHARRWRTTHRARRHAVTNRVRRAFFRVHCLHLCFLVVHNVARLRRLPCARRVVRVPCLICVWHTKVLILSCVQMEDRVVRLPRLPPWYRAFVPPPSTSGFL
jgi:hypothetical protein